MFKLLLTLAVFMMVAMALSGLRQHRLELTAQTARLQQTIEERRQTLWGQEVQIAANTDPRKVTDAIKASGIDLAMPGSTTQAATPELTGDPVGQVRGRQTPRTHH